MSSSTTETVALIIEDEREIAAQVAHRLGAEGWQVHVVHDGHAGVEQAQELNPDIIVLDVMLPGLDGLDVCRRIQANQHASGAPATPILMLTARDDETGDRKSLHSRRQGHEHAGG